MRRVPTRSMRPKCCMRQSGKLGHRESHHLISCIEALFWISHWLVILNYVCDLIWQRWHSLNRRGERWLGAGVCSWGLTNTRVLERNEIMFEYTKITTVILVIQFKNFGLVVWSKSCWYKLARLLHELFRKQVPWIFNII